MFYNTLIICESLQSDNYSSPHNKLSSLKKQGHYYQVRQGLYETERDIPPYILACSIYGPSYLSFEFVLSFYGLIPEKVTLYTSATRHKNRTKKFSNAFGNYVFQDIPDEAYPHETIIKTYKDRGYLIATPEKALCDTLYKAKPVGSIKALKELLFENLRIDELEFKKLNPQTLQFLCPLYRKKNLTLLNSMIEKMLSKGEI